MKKEENILIAEFMEIPKCDRCDNCGSYKFGTGIYAQPEKMSYHTSWEWLMPVIEKIESSLIDGLIGVSVAIEGTHCVVRGYEKNRQPIVIHQSEYGKRYANKIESVYEAVIEFIKYFNNPKTYWSTKFYSQLNLDTTTP